MLILKKAHYLRSMQSGVSAFWNEALHMLNTLGCIFLKPYFTTYSPRDLSPIPLLNVLHYYTLHKYDKQKDFLSSHLSCQI